MLSTQVSPAACNMSDTAAPAPSATLNAVHKHISSRCGAVSAAFLACKSGNADPEVCAKQGEAVTGCVVALCVRIDALREH